MITTSPIIQVQIESEGAILGYDNKYRFSGLR
jgi:hypothetical protein